jgi:hypothetical protein
LLGWRSIHARCICGFRLIRTCSFGVVHGQHRYWSNFGIVSQETS